MPGLQEGGWMVRMRDEGADTQQILNPTFGTSASQPTPATLKDTTDEAGSTAKAVKSAMIDSSVKRKITLDELQKHNDPAEPWFAVHGEVYDGTAFLSGHPGGAESITLVAGEDATEDFMAIHSPVSGAGLFANVKQTCLECISD